MKGTVTIYGVVYDKATGAPLSGATVIVGSQTSITGSDGCYELTNNVQIWSSDGSTTTLKIKANRPDDRSYVERTIILYQADLERKIKQDFNL